MLTLFKIIESFWANNWPKIDYPSPLCNQVDPQLAMDPLEKKGKKRQKKKKKKKKREKVRKKSKKKIKGT